MSEKFRLDRKIGFRNTFYTKCINVIIDSIGPSIIFRSIYGSLWMPLTGRIKIDPSTFKLRCHFSLYLYSQNLLTSYCLTSVTVLFVFA